MLGGAIHSSKISGNFGLKLNGSVRSNRKSFEKSGPPFEVDLFSRLDRSDRNGPFHLTIPTRSQSQDLAARYLPCTKWRKILITALLWIVNSRSIGVTRTCTVTTGLLLLRKQSVCFGYWRVLKTIFFPREIAMFFSSFDSNVVFWSHMANIWERSAQYNPHRPKTWRSVLYLTIILWNRGE